MSAPNSLTSNLPHNIVDEDKKSVKVEFKKEITNIKDRILLENEESIKEEIKTEDQDWPKLEIHPGGVIKHMCKARVKRRTNPNLKPKTIEKDTNFGLFSCGKCSENFPEIHYLVQHLRKHQNSTESNERKSIIVTAYPEDHDYYILRDDKYPDIHYI